jgi:carbamate kinase
LNTKKVAVVAIGGNSLIKDENHQSVQDQYQAARKSCEHIASMIELGWDVVVTHGNGPQVGFILLRSELASHVLHTVPLDACGADTQGAIGYALQQNLQNIYRERGIDKLAVTIVTQCVVDRADPAFQKPSKPIGPFYNEEKAKKYQVEEGWSIVEDAGRGWRRVVASPIPTEVVEWQAIKTLVDVGMTVVAVGGGGIPVVRKEDGSLEGTAAVIDKDFGSSLLARQIHADLFMISTAVEKAFINFRKPDQKALDTITVAEAKKYIQEGHFAAGSMLPKMKACIAFLEAGGKEAVITDPPNIARALKGQTGTHIIP